MTIRPAGSADRQFVLGLVRRFAEFELPPWLDVATVCEGTARRLNNAFDAVDGRSTILIAENSAGERLGFAWIVLIEDFYTGRDLGKISEIAVARDGTGAGAALMDAAERWALERGCDLMVLNVMELNAHARRFYERHGYGPEYTLMAKRIGEKW